jgi:hypothetical protein
MTVEAIAQYKAALGWLLDYEAAGIPAPSSIIEVFWSARNDLDSPFLDSHTLQLFQSILAFPVWLFNANNFGDPRRRKKEISPDLPPEFYTTADIIAPYQKIKFDPLILELFCVFQGIVLVFVWAVFLWAIVVAKTLPMVSSYPLFDFAVKPTSNLHDVVSERRHELWDAGDSRTLDIVKYVKVQDKS